MRYDLLKFLETQVNVPFQVIAVDTMDPCSRSPKGFKYLLVVAVQFAINTTGYEAHNYSSAFITFGKNLHRYGKYYGYISSPENTELCPDGSDKYVEIFSGLSKFYKPVKAKVHIAYLRNSKAYNLRKKGYFS